MSGGLNHSQSSLTTFLMGQNSWEFFLTNVYNWRWGCVGRFPPCLLVTRVICIYAWKKLPCPSCSSFHRVLVIVTCSHDPPRHLHSNQQQGHKQRTSLLRWGSEHYSDRGHWRMDFPGQPTVFRTWRDQAKLEDVVEQHLNIWDKKKSVCFFLVGLAQWKRKQKVGLPRNRNPFKKFSKGPCWDF